MRRFPEPELMESNEQALSYAKADFSLANNIFLSNFFESASINNQTKVLDVGCGDGEIPIKIYQKIKCQLTAIDGSENMLKQFILKKEKNNINTIKTHKKLINHKLFPERFFDIIINNSVLHHISDVPLFWKTLIRLVESNGKIYLMDLVRPKTNLELKSKLIKYGGTDPVLLKDFENSLRAAYTVNEVKEQLTAFKEISFNIKSVSDRHFFVTIEMKDDNLY